MKTNIKRTLALTAFIAAALALPQTTVAGGPPIVQVVMSTMLHRQTRQ